jgi:hypothetical protein
MQRRIQYALNTMARSSARSMRSRKVTPHTASLRVSAANVRWAERFELITDDIAKVKFAAIRCGSCAAHTFPRASEEVVSIGADLIAWLFLFDDREGEGSPGDTVDAMRTRFMTYEHAARTGQLPLAATPFHRALVDLRTRCRSSTSEEDEWCDRFAQSLGGYFDGCLREQPFRRSAARLDLAEYRRVRTLSIGLFPVFDVIQLEGGTLSASDFAHPTVARLRASAALLCAWVNDVYSFQKERQDGDPLNLVSVLASEYGLSIAEAMGAAAEVFNTDLAMFEEDMVTLESVGEDLRCYLEGLDDWVHGNLAWTGLSGRYKPRSARHRGATGREPR